MSSGPFVIAFSSGIVEEFYYPVDLRVSLMGFPLFRNNSQSDKTECFFMGEL